MRHQFWYPFTGENAINWLRTVIVRKDKKYVITQETLNSTLSEDGKWMFQEYQDLREQMAYISEEDMFVNGFRIGVGLILDAVGTYDSQFVRYHEE